MKWEEWWHATGEPHRHNAEYRKPNTIPFTWSDGKVNGCFGVVKTYYMKTWEDFVGQRKCSIFQSV
jgi:hypothetical protein